MKPWTADDIVDITDGKLHGHYFSALNISTDSRQLALGDVFLALSGEHFRGEDFVASARANGAVAAIVHTVQAVDIPQIVVKDTLVALSALANARREAVKTTVIALTGTNGKTSTKEMLKRILALKGKTLATLGNLNNAIGVPLTLLRLRDYHDYAVIEMGANHGGEIAHLTTLARPEIVGITNVSAAHLQGFGSYEGVVKAKSEIYTHSQAALALNNDLPCASEWRSRFKGRPQRSFALSAEADISAKAISADTKSFTLVIDKQSYPITWQLSGQHNIANALCACALADLVGIEGETMQQALTGLALKQARLSAYPIGIHTVYDDTYNANPASFRAAIDVLAQAENTLVIAGDMGELGEQASALHQAVGAYAREQTISQFWCVGAYAQAYDAGFQGARQFKTLADMVAPLQALLSATDKWTVLVKGSRSARMERIFSLSTLSEQMKEQL